jgi:hypothetical protein
MHVGFGAAERAAGAQEKWPRQARAMEWYAGTESKPKRGHGRSVDTLGRVRTLDAHTDRSPAFQNDVAAAEFVLNCFKGVSCSAAKA